MAAVTSTPLAVDRTKDIYGKDLAQYIFERQKQFGYDPLPALAVVPHEGGFSGAVGDSGTSFGPFQLHIGGALPKSIAASQAKTWANSPVGIDYALGRINSVVGKDTGTNAVTDIVYKFERPADPATETSKAISTYYGLGPDKPGASDWTSFDLKSLPGVGASLPSATLGLGFLGGQLGSLKEEGQNTIDLLSGAGGIGSGISKFLGVPKLPKNAIQRSGELLAGGVLIILGIIMVGRAATGSNAGTSPPTVVVNRARSVASRPQTGRTAASQKRVNSALSRDLGEGTGSE